MKRVIFLALLLILPIQAHAATFVQAQKVDSSGTSVNFPAITATASNLLVIFVRLGGNVTTTISDGTNTWTQIAGASIQNNSDSDSVYVYYAKNVAGGSTTVNVAPSSSVTVRGHIMEFSGLDTASPADQSNQLDNQVTVGGVTPAVTGNITTTAAGILAAGTSASGDDVYTAGTLGTGTGVLPTNGTTGRTAVIYHVEAGTGTYGGAINYGLGRALNFASIWNFKDAGGGATCAPSLTLIGVGRCE